MSDKKHGPEVVSDQTDTNRQLLLIPLVVGITATVLGAGLSHVAASVIEEHEQFTIVVLMSLLVCSLVVCALRIARKSRGNRRLEQYSAELGAVLLLLSTMIAIIYNHDNSARHNSTAARASGSAFMTSPATTGNGLQLVDVGFTETHTLPQVDIKVRNTGSQVVFIKRADFVVTKTWELGWFSAGGAVPPSYQYDVQLPLNGAPYTRSADVSQSVEPDGVDRFTFRLSTDQRISPFADYIYALKIKLVYNETSSVVESGQLIYCIGYPTSFRAFRDTSAGWLSQLSEPIPSGIGIDASDPNAAARANPVGINAYLIQDADRNRQIVDQIAALPGEKNLRMQVLIVSR